MADQELIPLPHCEHTFEMTDRFRDHVFFCHATIRCCECQHPHAVIRPATEES